MKVAMVLALLRSR